jgi:hypothetical protein
LISFSNFLLIDFDYSILNAIGLLSFIVKLDLQSPSILLVARCKEVFAPGEKSHDIPQDCQSIQINCFRRLALCAWGGAKCMPAVMPLQGPNLLELKINFN